MSGAAAVFASGSTALITGGASGIGLALGKLCHGKGMNVLLVDRNADALEQARLAIAGEDVDTSGPRVVTSVADVSLPEDWAALKDSALAKFGSIEFLALNAGVGGKGTWGDGDYFRTVRLGCTAVSASVANQRHRFSKRTSSVLLMASTRSCPWYKTLPRRSRQLLSLRAVNRVSQTRPETPPTMHPSLR